MDQQPPWSDHETLARTLAQWRQLYAGRDLFRLAAGPGWVRLHLAGEERVGLLLSNFPGARFVCSQTGRLPEPLDKALATTRKHPLLTLLSGAKLVSCGMLPDDRVAAFHLARPQGQNVVLLHQMFGARGNTTLVDRNKKLLWSVHRPPHTVLAGWPTKGTWTSGSRATEPTAPDFSAQALNHLAFICAEQERTTNRAAVNRQLKTTERLLKNLGRDLANADQGEQHRRKAEALAANLHTMTQGASEIDLADLRDGSMLKIALDPARNPAANMEGWFRRARKAENGLEIIRERHGETANTQAALVTAEQKLQQAEQQAETMARLNALQQWRDDHAELFPQARKRAGTRAPEEPVRPFRRYLIDGTWEVWVGRNNKENDELTHRAAHNRDIWLHAQGVSGSHVIIRAGGNPEHVPKSVLEKAAALAALNSKARNSQYVPVIHTEKRYVRKPRKAAAGTAVCLRDQSIFVEPGVMTGVEPA